MCLIIPGPCRLLAGADASLMAVHSSMAEVYPGNEEFAPSLVSLIGRAPIITDRAALEALKTEFEAGLTAVDEKLKTMKQLTDERAHFREEVQHYKDKLTKLEATEAAKVDPKTQQKVRMCVDAVTVTGTRTRARRAATQHRSWHLR